MTTRVTEIPPASSAIAAAYFESQMGLTTDCWDVHESMNGGTRISCCLTRAAVRISGKVMYREASACRTQRFPKRRWKNIRRIPSSLFIVPDRTASALIVQRSDWLTSAGP